MCNSPIKLGNSRSKYITASQFNGLLLFLLASQIYYASQSLSALYQYHPNMRAISSLDLLHRCRAVRLHFLVQGILHFNKTYIAGCSSSDEAVCTEEMRGKAASPTVFWLSLREAGSNWNGQGVPASLGIRAGRTESLQKSERSFSTLSADQSLSNDLME